MANRKRRPVEYMRELGRRGGLKSGECLKVSPINGRVTRAALREREAEHRVQAILRKHGL
jgi:hypothetical protein